MNAGSTTAEAAVSVANASWDVTADTYIGLTGIEFAAVNVGDWASIYLDAATVAVYIAQVTAVGALGVNITLSTTAKYGTKPAAGATGRSCKVGGPHLSPTPWNSTGLGATTVPASTRINIIAETYSRSLTDTFSIAGTAAISLWFRGYNTTPGDCDADPTLAKPLFSYAATLRVDTTGVRQLWSSISFLGERSGTIVSGSTGAGQMFVRCRAENTSTNAAAVAWQPQSTGSTCIACWGKTPTTATTNGTWNLGAGSTLLLIGCVAEGGGKGFHISTSTSRFIGCISLNSAGDGFLSATSTNWALTNCTVYNATSDGIEFTTAPTTLGNITGCAFWVCGGYGINNSSGTDTNLVVRVCNSFWSCTSGNENGFGDAPAFFSQQEVAQPYTSATDMTPVAEALARAAGLPPGPFENQTYRSAAEIGAVCMAGGGGGGGGGGLGVM